MVRCQVRSCLLGISLGWNKYNSLAVNLHCNDFDMRTATATDTAILRLDI